MQLIALDHPVRILFCLRAKWLICWMLCNGEKDWKNWTWIGINWTEESPNFLCHIIEPSMFKRCSSTIRYTNTFCKCYSMALPVGKGTIVWASMFLSPACIKPFSPCVVDCSRKQQLLISYLQMVLWLCQLYLWSEESNVIKPSTYTHRDNTTHVQGDEALKRAPPNTAAFGTAEYNNGCIPKTATYKELIRDLGTKGRGARRSSVPTCFSFFFFIFSLLNSANISTPRAMVESSRGTTKQPRNRYLQIIW